MPNLKDVIKISKQNYEILINGGTVQGHTYDPNALYLVEDNNDVLDHMYYDGDTINLEEKFYAFNGGMIDGPLLVSQLSPDGDNFGTAGQVPIANGDQYGQWHWGDIPTPSHVVTDNTNQTIGGAKTFSDDITLANQKTIKFAAVPGNTTGMSNYILVPKANNGTNGIAYLKFAIDDTSPSGQSPSQAGVNKTPSAANYTGFHYVKSSSTSGNDMNPFYSLHTSNNDFRILTTAFSISWYQQIATDFRSDNIYFRRCENGALQSWKRIAFESDLNNRVSFNTSDSSQVQNIRSLTQAQYNALTPDANTIYFIIG